MDKPMTPTTSSKELTFDQAIRQVMDNKRITRASWEDKREYCLLHEGFLSIHKSGESADKLRPWLVNDGDLLAIDWIVLPEVN